MSEARVTTYRARLYMSQADAFRLFFDEQVLTGNLRWTSNEFDPVRIDVEIEASARPIYVSRPSERVYADGHLLAFLPREYDHMPDAWEPTVFDLRVNGSSIERSSLERVLEACSPSDKVREVRELAAKIDALTGYWSRP